MSKSKFAYLVPVEECANHEDWYIPGPGAAGDVFPTYYDFIISDGLFFYIEDDRWIKEPDWMPLVSVPEMIHAQALLP